MADRRPPSSGRTSLFRAGLAGAGCHYGRAPWQDIKRNHIFHQLRPPARHKPSAAIGASRACMGPRCHLPRGPLAPRTGPRCRQHGPHPPPRLQHGTARKGKAIHQDSSNSRRIEHPNPRRNPPHLIALTSTRCPARNWRRTDPPICGPAAPQFLCLSVGTQVRLRFHDSSPDRRLLPRSPRRSRYISQDNAIALQVKARGCPHHALRHQPLVQNPARVERRTQSRRQRRYTGAFWLKHRHLFHSGHPAHQRRMPAPCDQPANQCRCT